MAHPRTGRSSYISPLPPPLVYSILVRRFEFSQHAVDQSIIRHISVQEIREAFADGTVIEDYPKDKYGPSCLVLGFTRAGRPIHVQCSHPSRPLVKIITVYEPDPSLWVDFRIRRARDEST